MSFKAAAGSSMATRLSYGRRVGSSSDIALIPRSTPMPSKRDVLADLCRDELVITTDRFELTVADRRSHTSWSTPFASAHAGILGDTRAGHAGVRDPPCTAPNMGPTLLVTPTPSNLRASSCSCAKTATSTVSPHYGGRS